jgi:hypothetical protein
MFEANNTERLLRVKKILAFVTSMLLVGISIWFSQKGFGAEATGYIWLGWLLGGVVTVIELVFNTSIKKLSITLIAGGVLAYSYGMYTNVIGIHEILGGSWVFNVVIGLFIEVIPEPLFAWSIGVYDGGDVLGNIGELFGTTPAPQHKQPQPMGFQQPKWNPMMNTQNQGKHSGKQKRQELEKKYHTLKPTIHRFDDDELE